MQCAILETVWALSFYPGWSDNSFGRDDVIHKEHLYSLGEDSTSFYCQIILVWLKNQGENFLFNARKEYYMRCLKSWPWGQLLGLIQSVFIPQLLSETEELGRVILMISGIAVPLSINCIRHVRLSFCCSVTVASCSMRPHGLQHARLPCPSLSPTLCSDSCPLSRWCRPAISSSVTPFSSFPASGFFPVSQLFASGTIFIYSCFTDVYIEPGALLICPILYY